MFAPFDPRALEGTLRHSDLASAVALLRLPDCFAPYGAARQSLSFLASHSLDCCAAVNCLLPRFEITMRRHALGFAAFDDGVRFPRIVRLALRTSRPRPIGSTVCAKRF